MGYFSEEIEKNIGYTFILKNLKTYTTFGLKLKHNLLPYKKSERKDLINELNNLEKFVDSIKHNPEIYRTIIYLLKKFRNILPSIRRLRSKNYILDEVELYEIKYFALNLEKFHGTYNKLNLDIKNMDLLSLKNLIELLDPDQTQIPTFYIYESYSDKLKELRLKKREIEEKIFSCEDKNNDLKNNDLKNRLNNERLNIVVLEEEEELKIKKELSKKIALASSTIFKNIEIIAKLDLAIAKAKLALNFNGIKPNISVNNGIYLKNSFNPHIKFILEKKKKDFVPISIKLKNGVSIITGANMAGKTVTLQTIVLNTFLAQLGFYVFAEEASIPILKYIFFVSDDMQDISSGLSTFGAEIININKILKEIDKGIGLVVLDEFARGTNPNEGKILVNSLCKHLNKKKIYSLITTHYDGVVEDNMVHYQVIGLKNINFDELKSKIDLINLTGNKQITSVDIIQEYMDYRLEKILEKTKVPKDALNIAELLGLDESIIEEAKKNYEIVKIKENKIY